MNECTICCGNQEQMEEEAKEDKPAEGKEALADTPAEVRHETLAQKIYSECRVSVYHSCLLWLSSIK